MFCCLAALLVSVAPAAEPDDAEVPAEADTEEDEDEYEVIVVTASRSGSPLGEAPVAVEVVSREEIEATGAESLGELLEEQPGLQIQDTIAGTAIRMQGMDPEHTLILVDGQRVLGRKDGVIDLSRFTMENIERIEIVKGPSSSLYGSDAMGGVVHIITRKPETGREVGLHVRGGTLERIDAAADVMFGDEVVRHKLSAGWHASDAWDLDPSDENTTSSAFDQGDAAYAATVRPSDDTQLDFTVSYLQRRLAGVDETITGAIYDTRAIVEDSRASAGGWWTVGPDTKLTVRISGSLYRAQQLNDQRGSSTLDNVSDDREQLGEGTIQLDQSVGKHFLTVGVDGLVQGIKSDRLGPGSGDRQRVALFAQDTWALGSEDTVRFTLAPGFRFDVDSQFGIAPTPRLATALIAGPVTLRVSAGTGFRAPNFRELYLLFENPGVGYVVAGNEALEPERSRNFNASVDYTPTTRFNMSVQAYRNDIENLINIGTVDQEPGASQVFGYENIDRAYTQGVDAQVRYRPKPFTLEVGYALTDTLDKDLKRPLEGRVPHRVTGSAAVDLPEDVMVRTQFGYASKRPFFFDEDGDDVEEQIFAPDRFTMDVRAVWKADPIELFAGCDNLFNVGEHVLAPTTPRFVYAGLNVRGRKESE